MSSQTIMVVEDDAATREFLADNLRADDYRVVCACTGRQALSLLEAESCDLMVLDVMLPDLSGYELCKRLRDTDGLANRTDPDLPVVMVTGRNSEADCVRGFDRGADDYLTKPFSYAELAMRIAAVLRRAQGRRRQGRIVVASLEVDPLAREVRLDGHGVPMSAKEFELLRVLAEEPARVFTKQELLHDVWGYALMGSTRTLDSHASRVRRKLQPSGRRWIVNVWGVGYKLTDRVA